MNFSEIRKLANEYNSCGDFKRRNELFCQIESYAEEVFKKLCKYNKNFLRDSGAMDDECWLSDFNSFMRLDWFINEGLKVSFCQRENPEENGHCVIPSKYFDYSDEDWKNP